LSYPDLDILLMVVSMKIIGFLGVFLLLAFSLASCDLLVELGSSDSPTTPMPTFSPLTPHPPSPTAPIPASASPDQPGAGKPEASQTSSTQIPLPSSTPAFARPAMLPDPAGYEWRLVVDGLSTPIGLENAMDGSGRLFAIEQPGLIRIIQDGSLLSVPFLDIRSRVGSSGSEQGLLGLAFHPRYAENGYFFVNYTDKGGDTVIARYRVSADSSLADPTTELRLLQVEQPYANHNGGDMAFGPDGYLYISLGDGGSGGDPRNNGQSLETLLGKILRIEVGEADNYSIPNDNPFVDGGGRPEIWAYGLRNPWRISFDRLTGDLYIADVGQNSWEEVNFQVFDSSGGENYGWNIMEASYCFQSSSCDQSGLTLPVVEYALHVQGDCAVTGGYVYRGNLLPAWQGIYIYGDYCSGRVWGLFLNQAGVWENGLLFETSARITAFSQDEDGEIYLVHHGGSVYQLIEK
jgi:glucose/arabinose dehydrogenase